MKHSIVQKIVHMSLYIRAWSRAYDAKQKRDWVSVVEQLDALHERGLSTNGSRLWLGTAYASLGDWERAAAEFRAINGRITKNDSEAVRRYNYALALAKLGQYDDAILTLDYRSMAWPERFVEKARILSDYLVKRELKDIGALH